MKLHHPRLHVPSCIQGVAHTAVRSTRVYNIVNKIMHHSCKKALVAIALYKKELVFQHWRLSVGSPRDTSDVMDALSSKKQFM